MNFIPLGFIMELIHPPMNLPDRVLKEIFLEVSETCRYSTFQLVEGRPGAILSSGDKRRCEIYADRLVIREDRTELSFREFCLNSLNLVDAIRKKSPIPVFLTAVITTRNLLPLPPNHGDSARLLIEKCWKPPQESFDVFKRPLSGMGFRLVFPPYQKERSEVQMRFEPCFQDRKMFFLEIVHRFFHPHQNREDLQGSLDKTHDFLFKEAAEFIERLQTEEQI